MAFQLPELPYPQNALEPHVSAETLQYHHGKHHKKYVDTLNGLVEGTADADKSLEDLIKTTSGKLFNQAAQVYNHTFYWNCMGPGQGGEPKGALADAINASFGSFAEFKKQFTTAAAGHFGSGWAWLVKSGDKLEITTTHDAANPLTDGKTPLMTCDVWEHAYYVDYRNDRGKYLDAFWKLVNWDFVSSQL